VRALRFHAPGDLRCEEVPDPEPGPGDVLVQVEAALADENDAATCGRRPRLAGEAPSRFGRKFCGVDVAAGRRVVAASAAPCGSCAACGRGAEDLCENPVRLLESAYAELLVVPRRIVVRNLLRVPPGLSSEVAAMTEPLACCLHRVGRARIDRGQSVVVLGPGPIGLMLCACARDAGARVIVVGGGPELRALAPAFGGSPGDGRGADVVLDSVSGAFAPTPRTMRAALAFLASGAYPWERLITHRVGLDALPALFADPPRELLEAAVLP
jgi:L-iditol 2-dehydrogenase